MIALHNYSRKSQKIKKTSELLHSEAHIVVDLNFYQIFAKIALKVALGRMATEAFSKTGL